MNKIYSTLIVDDEPDIRELLEITLGRMDIKTFSAGSVAEAVQLLQTKPFNLCLTDMRLPDQNGIELVHYIQANFPELPVAMISAYGSMDAAISALKAGAFDFVSKPIDLQKLRDLVISALKLSPENDDTSPQRTGDSEHLLLGNTAIIDTLRVQIKKLSRSQAPVYIRGESGSGKELVARLIHQLGPRKDEPFIAVNCGAIPGELMESEFFGHKKGSFTGATEDKKGLFQAAHNSTLFLDEIAELPLAMQVKLLRAIQEKAIRPVGTQKEITVNVRILSATHKDLVKATENGTFRQDLYYRINVIELNVPSLKQRKEDIPLLVSHYLNNLALDNHSNPPQISEDALDLLKDYSFPGNVRELENILERALTMCEEDIIQAKDLHLSPAVHQQEATSSTDDTNSAVDYQGSLETHLEEIERNAILQALEECRWNKTATAKKLGMSFRSLRYRLKKFNID